MARLMRHVTQGRKLTIKQSGEIFFGKSQAEIYLANADRRTVTTGKTGGQCVLGRAPRATGGGVRQVAILRRLGTSGVGLHAYCPQGHVTGFRNSLHCLNRRSISCELLYTALTRSRDGPMLLI